MCTERKATGYYVLAWFMFATMFCGGSLALTSTKLSVFFCYVFVPEHLKAQRHDSVFKTSQYI